MNIYFISLHELANIPKESPSFEVGTHYMKYTILDNVSTMFPMRPEEDIYSSAVLTPSLNNNSCISSTLKGDSIHGSMNHEKSSNCIGQSTDSPSKEFISNELFFQVKKEKIQKLKIKEPVKKTNWVYYGDIFTNTKEIIKELKLKGPVVKSTFTDDWP